MADNRPDHIIHVFRTDYEAQVPMKRKKKPGLHLYCNKDVYIGPGEVTTGIGLIFPENTFGRLCEKEESAFTKLIVLDPLRYHNTPITVKMFNLSRDSTAVIRKGCRFAIMTLESTLCSSILPIHEMECVGDHISRCNHVSGNTRPSLGGRGVSAEEEATPLDEIY